MGQCKEHLESSTNELKSNDNFHTQFNVNLLEDQ